MYSKRSTAQKGRFTDVIFWSSNFANLTKTQKRYGNGNVHVSCIISMFTYDIDYNIALTWASSVAYPLG